MPPVRSEITINPEEVNFPVIASTVQVSCLATTGAPQDNRANTIAATSIAGLILLRSMAGTLPPSIVVLGASATGGGGGRRLLSSRGGGLKNMGSGSSEFTTGPWETFILGAEENSPIGADCGIVPEYVEF